ncbi:MAG TPA: hypothetical protein VII06_02110 [Chloroflexota bacterium]|jgi:hypothetical protein
MSVPARRALSVVLAAVATLGVLVVALRPDAAPVAAAGVVGAGTAASCTEAALNTALAGGGSVTFNCGAAAVVINVTAQVSTHLPGSPSGARRA